MEFGAPEPLPPQGRRMHSRHRAHATEAETFVMTARMMKTTRRSGLSTRMSLVFNAYICLYKTIICVIFPLVGIKGSLSPLDVLFFQRAKAHGRPAFSGKYGLSNQA